MPTKDFDLPEIGKVKIYKRRGSRGIRISLHPEQYVRVTMPSWLPYKVGLNFVQARSGWIDTKRKSRRLLTQDMIIGKKHCLKFFPSHQSITRAKVGSSVISVHYPAINSISDDSVQETARKAALTVLKIEAELLLKSRLKQLSVKHGFTYRLLNTMLMTLPWSLIDHVLLHELLHTKILKHGPDFWIAFEKLAPGAKKRQKQLRNYQPQF